MRIRDLFSHRVQRTMNTMLRNQSCSDLAGVVPHGRGCPESVRKVNAGANIGPERIYQQICGGISCRRGPRCRSGQHPPDLFGSNMPVPPHRLGSVIVRAIHRGRKSDRRQQPFLPFRMQPTYSPRRRTMILVVVARPLAELHCLLAAFPVLSRHSPYAIQIRGIRTTFPPPRELYPLCSHPMA